eukprot:m.74884 g.74884  ORF g.74884 m.74884 type:complete len:462 (+) comp12483_c0_seq3:166-1551(+)
MTEEGVFCQDGEPVKFYMARGPRKVKLRPLIEEKGGVVLNRDPDREGIWLVEDKGLDSYPKNTFFDTYIEECINKGKLLPLTTFKAVAPAKAERESTGKRQKYTAEEDVAVACGVKFMQETNSEYKHRTGKKMFRELEALGVGGGHPSESLRTHYIDKIQPFIERKNGREFLEREKKIYEIRATLDMNEEDDGKPELSDDIEESTEEQELKVSSASKGKKMGKKLRGQKLRGTVAETDDEEEEDELDQELRRLTTPTRQNNGKQKTPLSNKQKISGNRKTPESGKRKRILLSEDEDDLEEELASPEKRQTPAREPRGKEKETTNDKLEDTDSGDDDDDDDDLDRELRAMAERQQENDEIGQFSQESVEGFDRVDKLREIIELIQQTGYEKMDVYKALYLMSGSVENAIEYLKSGSGVNGERPWLPKHSRLLERDSGQEKLEKVEKLYGSESTQARIRFVEI